MTMIYHYNYYYVYVAGEHLRQRGPTSQFTHQSRWQAGELLIDVDHGIDDDDQKGIMVMMITYQFTHQCGGDTWELL